MFKEISRKIRLSKSNVYKSRAMNTMERNYSLQYCKIVKCDVEDEFKYVSQKYQPCIQLDASMLLNTVYEVFNILAESYKGTSEANSTIVYMYYNYTLFAVEFTGKFDVMNYKDMLILNDIITSYLFRLIKDKRTLKFIIESNKYNRHYIKSNYK